METLKKDNLRLFNAVTQNESFFFFKQPLIVSLCHNIKGTEQSNFEMLLFVEPHPTHHDLVTRKQAQTFEFWP